MELLPCPCCGYRTLDSLGAYEICVVCWWEDDGQDNDDADVVRGGPNGDLSLTQARVNFLKQGIFDPNREDLRRSQSPPEKYNKGREFMLSASENLITEPAKGWRAKAKNDQF